MQFDLEKYWRVPPAELRRAERDIHRLLADYRINKKREFFQIDPDLAIKSVNEYLRFRGFSTNVSSDQLSTRDKVALVAMLIAITVAGYLVSMH